MVKGSYLFWVRARQRCEEPWKGPVRQLLCSSRGLVRVRGADTAGVVCSVAFLWMCFSFSLVFLHRACVYGLHMHAGIRTPFQWRRGSPPQPKSARSCRLRSREERGAKRWAIDRSAASGSPFRRRLGSCLTGDGSLVVVSLATAGPGRGGESLDLRPSISMRVQVLSLRS